ncbi:FHA domain-containing protein [Nonomuraea indica]|uniref:FHA domain-containing protein n=1 Tax=Nonomuraea indica TaxID=1581193 RepID=A0ABW8A724_9ACTN
MTGQGFGLVRPLPGDGLVAYLGGLLLACDAGEAAADDLIEALRSTAAAGGDGRALARRAAQVLAANMTGDPATCAVAGPVGDGGVAVLVSGAAAATISTADGETRLSGSDSLTWADRLIGGPVTRVELTLPGAGRAHPAVRLDGGVVHGAGLAGEFGEQAAAPVRQLTSELPDTALHFEPDLARSGPAPEPVLPSPEPVQAAPEPVHAPPATERPAVNNPPYPMSGDHPPAPQGLPAAQHSAPAQHGFQPGPPSGPQAAEPSPYRQEQYNSFSSLDEPAAGSSGPTSGDYDQPAPDPFGQPGQPGQPGQHLSAVPDYFDAGPQQAPDHADQPGPQPMGAPEPYDQPPQQEQPDHGDRPLVYGVDCKNDHFNDPRASYCAVCGIALVQRTLVPYKGPRPSLGVLVLDDGTALPLESDYLLGRDPERAPEVAGGSARPAKVTSPDGSVSRRHLRVALDGWDVNLVDLGSVNGTQIQPPGDPNFYDIPPNEPVTIAPGTTVRVGVSRTLRFEPHRG